jgi:adhesin/invasin
VTDNLDGTYSATVTSGTHAATYTITARDGALSDSKSFTQNSGSAPAHISLASLSSRTVGGGRTTATVTVTDAFGNPIGGETVTMAPSPSGGPTGPSISSVTDNGNGTYTATVTSGTHAATYTITAHDRALSDAKTFTQTHAAGAHISLALTAASVNVGGKTTSATATVTDSFGNAVPGDAVRITPSSGGPSGPSISSVSDNANGTYSATITSGTHAGGYTITAADGALNNAKPFTQTHGQAHGIALSLSPPVLKADGLSTSTATATVTDANANPIAGERLLLSADNPRVHIGTVTDHGNGTYTAVVTSSNMPATVSVVATDTAVSPAISGEASLSEVPAPSLIARTTMQWSFYFAPRYTKVLSLMVNGAQIGSEIQMFCSGHGCPFKRWFEAIVGHRACKRHSHRRCLPAGTYDLSAPLRGRHLRPGAHLVVEITRVGWIGKYYSFTIRSARPPKIRISCVAPQGSTPGQGCS